MNQGSSETPGPLALASTNIPFFVRHSHPQLPLQGVSEQWVRPRQPDFQASDPPEQEEGKHPASHTPGGFPGGARLGDPSLTHSVSQHTQVTNTPEILRKPTQLPPRPPPGYLHYGPPLTPPPPHLSRPAKGSPRAGATVERKESARGPPPSRPVPPAPHCLPTQVKGPWVGGELDR